MPVCANFTTEATLVGQGQFFDDMGVDVPNIHANVWSIEGEPKFWITGSAMECAPDQVVFYTQAEIKAMQPPASPFNLDPESAVAIGGAILLLWAVAYVLRMARKSVDQSTGD